MVKRAFDVVASGSGIILLSPLLMVIALVIRLSGSGPVFYRQTRVGRFGRPFQIWKFRTMVVGAERTGPCVTQRGDARITRVGRWLRRTKFDELPQLWNVLRGDMSLVGPRPEVPKYVELYTAEQRAVLELRPGITDLASIEFRREEELLQAAEDMERFYVETCIPRKIELNLRYAQRAGFWSDLGIILRTLLPFGRAKHPSTRSTGDTGAAGGIGNR